MKINSNRIKIILVISMLVTYSNGQRDNRTCELLKYSYPLKDYPDIVIIDAKMQGLCHLQNNISKPIRYSDKYGYMQGLAYDPSERTIYYGVSGMQIYKTLLSDNTTKTFFTLDYNLMETIGRIEYLAYDWIARDMYILFRKAIGVVESKLQGKLKILRANESMSYYGIAVHPKRGHLYIHHDLSKISRMSLDGSNSRIIVNVSESYQHAVCRIESIAIDYENDRLYWTVSPNDKGIRHSNLDGTNVVALPALIQSSGCLSLAGKYIYFDNLGPGTTYITRQEKDKTVDDKFLISNGDDVCVDMLAVDNPSSQIKEIEHLTTSSINNKRIPGVTKSWSSNGASNGCFLSKFLQLMILFFCFFYKMN